MELYIIRHGKTVWNEAGKLQGSNDIELNSKGREAAGKLGEKLENVHFDRIYSSPLIRAFETANLIRGHRNIEIKRDVRLKEISFGVEEGCMYQKWLEPESPYRFFFNEPGKYNPPENGETLEELCARTKDFIQKEIEPQAETAERLMIVAHGALNAGIMCYLENRGPDQFWGPGLQENCQATIFTFDGKNWKRK